MTRALLVAGGLFFLSGASGLAYQVAWIKLLSIQFGSSAWSISTVVAAFMAGLGLGSWWAGRRAARIARPLRAFALLELGIALCGLVSVQLLGSLDLLIAPIYLQLDFGWFVLVRFLLTFGLLLLPTALMGASLPVLAAGMARDRSVGQVVGWLYGINTLGAAAGTLATGFWLLPWLALQRTVFVAVGVGLLVALLAYLADREPAKQAVELPEAGSGKTSPALLAALFGSGGLALFYEIGWTRLLAPILGSSTYAFTVILTTYLIGLGLGSLASGRWTPQRAHRSWLALLIVITSVCVVAGLFVVNLLPALFTALAAQVGSRPGLLFAAQGLVAGALLFLPTLAMGATVPLAIAAHHAEGGDAGRAIGTIYAANTLGSIVGSLLAGFVLLPWLGVSLAMLSAGAAGIVLGVLVLLTDDDLPRARRGLWAVGGIGGALALLLLSPQVNMSQLHDGVFRRILGKRRKEHKADLLFAREGLTSTVTIYRNPHATWLKVNGKTDASSGEDLVTQYLLGHLPLFLCPSPQDVCVIGLGSGATVRAVAAHPVRSLDVVELEPAVVQASSFFESVNNNVLERKFVRVYIEDGRSFLRYRPKMYDVIISEPSNPWIAGVSALFTTEFYGQVRARLNPDGVFCQWIQFYELSDETLNVMLRTLGDAFAHVSIFLVANDLICLASNEPLGGNLTRWQARLRLPEVKATLERVRIRNAYELMSSYFASLPADASRFPTEIRNRDTNLWLEYRAPIEMYLGRAPSIRGLPPREHMRRISKQFFPGVPEPALSLAISRAVYQRRPREWRLISSLSRLVQDPAARDELSKLALDARSRSKQIRGNGRRLRDARLLIAQGSSAAARALLKQILQSQPHRSAAHRLLGDLAFRGDPQLARSYYLRALALNPDDYVSRANLGALSFREGKTEQAARHFRESIRLNPLYPRSRGVWIAMLMDAGRQEEAGALYVEARDSLDAAHFREVSEVIGKISGRRAASQR